PRIHTILHTTLFPSHRTRTRAINASHDRNPCQLLLLVLLSEAAGGGRTALTLKKVSDAFPKAASEPGGFFVAASLGRPQPKMETDRKSTRLNSSHVK